MASSARLVQHPLSAQQQFLQHRVIEVEAVLLLLLPSLDAQRIPLAGYGHLGTG